MSGIFPMSKATGRRRRAWEHHEGNLRKDQTKEEKIDRSTRTQKE